MKYNNIQLFNGSAGNRSKYFSRGIGKNQSALLPEVSDRGQYNTLVFLNIEGEIVLSIVCTPIK